VNFNGQFLVGWRNIRNSNFEFQRVFTFLGCKSGLVVNPEPSGGGVLMAEISADDSEIFMSYSLTACRPDGPVRPFQAAPAGAHLVNYKYNNGPART